MLMLCIVASMYGPAFFLLLIYWFDDKGVSKSGMPISNEKSSIKAFASLSLSSRTISIRPSCSVVLGSRKLILTVKLFLSPYWSRPRSRYLAATHLHNVQ